MPDELVRIIGDPAEAFGFDLETHDKAPSKRKGRPGEFGNYTLRSEEDLDFLRIVQLGWAAVDPVSKKCFPKSYLVRPVGFVITEGVTAIHKIAHDDALRKGRPLAEVLEDFMQDVRGAKIKPKNFDDSCSSHWKREPAPRTVGRHDSMIGGGRQ